jgi:hypothetical protein
LPLPSYSLQQLQPLDVEFFKPLNTYDAHVLCYCNKTERKALPTIHDRTNRINGGHGIPKDYNNTNTNCNKWVQE